MTDYTVAEIAEKLADRAGTLAQELLPNGTRQSAYWRCGGIEGEPGQSLAVTVKGNKVGRWIDYSNPDDRGDMLDLIQAVNHLNKADAVQWAKAWLGISAAGRQCKKKQKFKGATPKRAAAREQYTRETEFKRRRAYDIWRAALPAAGTPVEAYLHGRAINFPVPAVLRYAPLLEYPGDKISRPAMLAAYQDAAGKFCGVQRTWLDISGASPLLRDLERLGADVSVKVADLKPKKMSLGPPAGAAVFLTPSKPTLALSEGVETGLSVAEVRDHWGVWSTSSVANMAGVPVPPVVERLILLRDGDSKTVTRGDGSTYIPADLALEAAAQHQLAIAKDAGRPLVVEIASAAAGQDFNDMKQAGAV